MAKKDRNATNAAASEASSDQANAEAASASTDATDATDAAPAPIPMDEFISRSDRGDWISVKDAAAMIGGDMDAQKLRNASNNRAEFRAAGAKLLVAVPGYDIKPLTYLHRSAIEAYQANNASGNTRSARIAANGKRWIIRLTAEQEAAFRAGTLDTTTIALEVASAPHKKKDATASADQPAAATDATADQPADNTAPLGGDQPADQPDPALDQFGNPAPWSHADDPAEAVNA